MTKPIKIKLVFEQAKNKVNGKVVLAFKKIIKKDEKTKEVKEVETDEPIYQRNDIEGILTLLQRFDTKMHDLKAWKMCIKVKDKVRQALLDDAKEIDLTLDEATFLKLYFTEFPDKDGKTLLRDNSGREVGVQEFEMRTLTGVLEQFDE